METRKEVATQLRLLGDLRDVLEKYLALSRKSAAAGEDTVHRITDLLISIQSSRNALLVRQTAAAGEAAAGELAASRAILEASVDLLKGMATLYPPLYSPLHDFMTNVEAHVRAAAARNQA